MPIKAAQRKKPDRTNNSSVDYVLIGNIIPDPDQPRKHFDPVELDALAKTLETHGQLQPIRVRRSLKRGKEVILIDGERRLRAGKIAGLKTLACVIVDGIEADVCLEEQLIANCCRADLEPIERANAFSALMRMKDWNGKQVAERLQFSESTVTRSLQLLELPASLQEDIREGRISARSGAALSTLNPEDQAELSGTILAEGMTRDEVLEAVKEKLETAKEKKVGGTKPLDTKGRFDPNSVLDLESLATKLGSAMIGHLVGKGKKAWGVLDVIVVLLEMGFSHPDFDGAIGIFTRALGKLRGKIAFPMYSEVLACATRCGWILPATEGGAA